MDPDRPRDRAVRLREGGRHQGRLQGVRGEGEFKVPQAFTFAPPAGQKLSKGATVLYTVVTSGECGRVVDLHGDTAKVSFVWASKVDARDVSTSELLVLDGSLAYGAPILYREDEDQTWVDTQLAYQDGKTAWLSNGEKTALKNVRAMDVTKSRKAGEAVLARESTMMGMAPATIKKVLDDGLRYEVEFEGKKKGTAEILQRHVRAEEVDRASRSGPSRGSPAKRIALVLAFAAARTHAYVLRCAPVSTGGDSRPGPRPGMRRCARRMGRARTSPPRRCATGAARLDRRVLPERHARRSRLRRARACL